MQKQELGGVTTGDFCKFSYSGEPPIPFGGLPTTQEKNQNDFSVDPHHYADGFGWSNYENLQYDAG